MEEISVKTINPLTDNSVLRARKSICADFTDGRHMVVVPVMGYGTVVRSVDEFRLAEDGKILAHISFKGDAPAVKAEPSVLASLPGYLHAIENYVLNLPDNDKFNHIREVAKVLKEVYPQTVR